MYDQTGKSGGDFTLFGGRRRYNASRRYNATRRRAVVARLLRMWGLHHGVQRQIAEQLGLTRSTISRDFDLLLGGWRDPGYESLRRAEETASRRLRHRAPIPPRPAETDPP